MKIIGIDLGTTNSCAYYLDENQEPLLLLTERQRYKIFPSVAWAPGPDQETVVGHAAKARIGLSPAPIIAVKRKMGTTETVFLGGSEVTPVEVSARILQHIKKEVERSTQDQVGGVIVTVPAYFDSAPRNDTYLAAVQAFFEGDESLAEGRLKLMLEPEAAALAYSVQETVGKMRVLVYDFGGGTFDVTVLERSPETGVSVLKFGGDPYLGGDNIDDRLASWILYRLRGGHEDVIRRITESPHYPPNIRYTILQQVLNDGLDGTAGTLRPEDEDLRLPEDPPFALGLNPEDLEDSRRIQVVKLLAENAKKDLVSAPEAIVAKQGAFQDKEGALVDVDLSIGLQDFNLLIGDFIAATVECARSALSGSHLRPEDLDLILLVGGSSRMPIVAEELSSVFGRPVRLEDPDLIVARGAALQARYLNPPPLGVRAKDAPLTIEFPSETAETTVTIRARLASPLSGHAYLMRDGEEVDDAPVSQDRFHFSSVPLAVDALNRFRIEVVDEQEEPVADADFIIRHDSRAVESEGHAVPKITKVIRALGTKGYATLFEEGLLLPISRPFVCSRATNDDHIDIEFFEGTRWLATLHIPNVDPAMPIGALIDLNITVSDNYSVQAVATIRDTGQSQPCDFKISRLVIPLLNELEEDLSQTLDQFANDLVLVRDANQRTEFYRQRLRLDAEFRKERRALKPDRQKLFSVVSELRALLVEVRASQVLLEPGKNVFDRLVTGCRGLAKSLPEHGTVEQRDVEERIAALEHAGHQAWDQESATEWRRVFTELKKLHSQLEQAVVKPPRHPMTALEIQRGLLAWLSEIHTKVEENDLLGRFADEIRQVQSAVRNLELRDEEEARAALLVILDKQLRPLDARIEGEIARSGGQMTPGLAKVTFD